MNLIGNRLKKALFRLLLVLGGLAIAWFVGEVVVYLTWGDRMNLFPRYVTDATYGGFRIRRNVPNARYCHRSKDGKWEFRINGSGFRSDNEFDYPKPEDTVRVLTLGDSFTIGFEVAQDETYSAVIEKYLNTHGLKAEVINGGVSGFGNAEELVFLEQEEGIKFAPDFVILGFYVNDLMDNVRSDLYRLDGTGALVQYNTEYLPAIRTRNFLNSFFVYRWLSEHSYLHNYFNAVATLRIKEQLWNRKRGEVVSGLDDRKNSTWYDASLAFRLLERIRRVADENNAVFILVDVAQSSDNGPARSLPFDDAEIAQLCDEYVDSAELLKEYHGLTHIYRPRGQGHWTPFAHLIVGKRLGELIEQRHLEK